MLIKPFILTLKKTVLFILLMAACASCSGGGGGTAADGSMTIRHQVAAFPSGLAHMHYSGYDAQDNRIYVSDEFSVSSLHTLTNIPGNVISMAIAYHTSTEEELY